MPITNVFTQTSPGIGQLPSSVSVYGGVVLDLLGANGTRIVAQVAPASLFKGSHPSPFNNYLHIGTITFSPAVIEALGGGIEKANFRITLFNGDSVTGHMNDYGPDFDTGTDLALQFEHTGGNKHVGYFGQTPTVSLNNVSLIQVATWVGFPGSFDQNLSTATGWFSVPEAALVSLYDSIATGSLGFGVYDVDPMDVVQYYDFTAGLGGNNVSTIEPTVIPTVSFTVDDVSISAGGSTTLRWTITHSTSQSIDQGVGSVAASGERSVSPTTNTTYTLTALGTGGGSSTETVTVSVEASAIVISFSASKTRINLGQVSTLNWNVQNASSVSIDQGLGTVSTGGSQDVSPTSTRTYTLTAVGPCGEQTAQVTITLNPAPSINDEFTLGDFTSSPIIIDGISSYYPKQSWEVLIVSKDKHHRRNTLASAPKATVEVGSDDLTTAFPFELAEYFEIVDNVFRIKDHGLTQLQLGPGSVGNTQLSRGPDRIRITNDDVLSITSSKISDCIPLSKLCPGVLPATINVDWLSIINAPESFPVELQFVAPGDVTTPSASSSPQIANARVVKLQGFAVSNQTPSDSQVLTWNASTSRWEPKDAASGSATLGGDVSGSSAATTVAKLQGHALSASTPQTNQVLAYDGSVWRPMALNTIGGGGGGSSTLSGDVIGPNTDTVVGRIQGKPISTAAPSAGQVLTWNGSQWAPAAAAGAGVTSINTLTGPITIAGGPGITVGRLGNTITIQITGAGGSSVCPGGGALTVPSGVSASIKFRAGIAHRGNWKVTVQKTDAAMATAITVNMGYGYTDGIGVTGIVGSATAGIGTRTTEIVLHGPDDGTDVLWGEIIRHGNYTVSHTYCAYARRL